MPVEFTADETAALIDPCLGGKYRANCRIALHDSIDAM